MQGGLRMIDIWQNMEQLLEWYSDKKKWKRYIGKYQIMTEGMKFEESFQKYWD